MPPKKKKRKPRSRARGTAAGAAAPQVEQAPQSQEKRRERLEARREAKARALAQRHRQQQRARIVRIVVLLASVVAIVWFLFLRNSIPNAIAGHELEHFDTFSSESLANQLHTSDPVSYDQVPPVSGQHSPIPADCGVYGSPLADENMVHSLEHGAVGILYQPGADVEEIRQAEEIVGDYETHVFSAPYPDLPDPYTIVAWAHLMRLDSFDRDAIVEFIETFRQGGDAPEEQDCPKGANQPFEPSPTGSPTPTPGETPAEDDGGGDQNDEGNGGGGNGGGGNDKKEKKKD
jgi:hypothetical protein